MKEELGFELSCDELNDLVAQWLDHWTKSPEFKGLIPTRVN